MKNVLFLLTISSWTSAAMAANAGQFLPQPHYHRQPGDPEWLAQAVQFHGHLGPWAVAGVRAGMTGRKAVGAKGYFDVRVEAEGPFVRPPQSCFLDGLQVGAGATLGKRNLTWKRSKNIVIRVKNTQTGATAEIRPREKLLKIVETLVPDTGEEEDHHHHDEEAHHHHAEDSVEALARELAGLPEKEVFSVKLLKSEQTTENK
ncbi:MAG: formylmethanofuran dehydrogenase subunit E family protein [Pirellulales bacterium]|nr:formylmethanofuran dehydrogenase subunit E family protein [Pirellulales bacterium]